jgi:hypothetical protein
LGKKYADGGSKGLVIFSQLGWFHYYYFRKNALPLPLDQNTVDFSAVIKNSNEVWLLVNDRYTGGWPVNGFLPVQKATMDAEFFLKDSVSFKQTQALFYRRKN